MKIKELTWSEPSPPIKDGPSYDHVIAKTPFGDIAIEWKSWKSSPSYDVMGMSWTTGLDSIDLWGHTTLDKAKLAAFQVYCQAIMECIADEQPNNCEDKHG